LFSEENAGDRETGQGDSRRALSRGSGRKEGQKMTIDTKIRHVTKPGTNIFRELGFEKEEAKELHAELEQRINATRALKEQLMGELALWIVEKHLKQSEAAEILKVSRPRVTDVVNKKTGKFTIDTLVDMLSRIGKSVRLTIR
jgi:predicted XRE-type DNA-binding protein